MNKENYEEWYPKIIVAIRKRKTRWFYKISWISFEDIEMMIATHIYQKWHLYNGKYPLINWVNRIITNQFRNILRDYTKNSPLNTTIDGRFDLHKPEVIDFTTTIKSMKEHFAKDALYLDIFESFYIEGRTEIQIFDSLKEKYPDLSKKEVRLVRQHIQDSLKKLIKEDKLDIYIG